MTSLSFAHPRRGTSALASATALVVAAAVGIAVALLTQGDSRPAPAPAQPTGADSGLRLSTSFGSVSVDYVSRMVGSNRPMGLRVPAGHLPVQLGVTVVNVTDRPLPITSDLLSMQATTGGMDAGRLVDGAVPPYKAHRLILRYAVPETATLPHLVVADPAGPEKRVALGPTEGLSTVDVAKHHFGGPTS